VSALPELAPKGRTPAEEVEAWTRAARSVAEAARPRTESEYRRAFARVAWETADDRFWNGDIDLPEREQPQPPPLRVVSTNGGRRFEAQDDPLLQVPAPTWVYALTGIAVPDRGAVIRCPLPDHDDRTPSCRIHGEAGWGTWFCHGCHRGGDVYAFAAALWGISRPRGEAFRELKRDIARALLGRAA
jgi:hypothetical protein